MHGIDIPVDTPISIDDPIDEMNVHLISVSPEHQSSLPNVGVVQGVVESRVGKVSDLVKQFDDNQKMEEGMEVGGDKEEQDGGDRMRLSHGAIAMFEKSGVIIGMVS